VRARRAVKKLTAVKVVKPPFLEKEAAVAERRAHRSREMRVPLPKFVSPKGNPWINLNAGIWWVLRPALCIRVASGDGSRLLL
jgi:hypothetical protein